MMAFLLVIGAIGIVSLILRASSSPTAPKRAPRVSAELRQLSEHADRLYRDRKWLAAEKAYLRVLKLDHRHLVAYSHLGVIYSTQKNAADAIECFQMAAQIKPSAGTFQNLALGYYENRNYIKAAAAFEKAIMFEASSGRYIGLSKARKQLHDVQGVVTALERAVALEPTQRHLGLLEEAYIAAQRPTEAYATREKLQHLPQQPASNKTNVRA